MLDALRPAQVRIKAATEIAKNKWTCTPHYGSRIAYELHSQAGELLGVIDNALQPGNPVRAGMHDAIAEAMFLSQIAYGKKTEDWAESIRLLELAKSLAEGSALRARLDENIKICRNNFSAGNSWYSKEYWELPAYIIEQLESARTKFMAKDYDGAIQALVVLDPKHGRPVRRALSCSLNCRAVRDYNAAIDKCDDETDVMKTVLGNFRTFGHRFTAPVAGSSSWTPRPPCLSCLRTTYTSWMNFTWRGTKLFMCMDCWSRHESQEWTMRRTLLAGPLRSGLQHLVLADEVDPQDPGVRRNIEIFRQKALELGIDVPSSASLREDLAAKNKTRRVWQTFAPTPEDGVCHFCGKAGADASSAIVVSMCGAPRQPVPMMFHNGAEYSLAEIVVPRCLECRDEHRALPLRVRKWEADRREAARDEHFPLLTADLDLADKGLQLATEAVERRKQELSDRRAAFEKAKRIGTYCERDATHTSAWDHFLCKRCDSRVFKFDRPAWTVIVVGAALLGAGGYLLAQHAVISSLAEAAVQQRFLGATPDLGPVVFGLAVCAFGAIALAAAMKVRQRWQRRLLRRQRLRMLLARRESETSRTAQELEAARMSLSAASSELSKRRNVHSGAKQALADAKARAMANFEHGTPRPRLRDDVRPEAEFLDFGRVRQLVWQRWGFGLTLDDRLRPACSPASAARGLQTILDQRVARPH